MRGSVGVSPGSSITGFGDDLSEVYTGTGIVEDANSSAAVGCAEDK